MLRAALLILGKDLRLRLRDRSLVLFAVVVPLGLTALFSVIIPEPGELTLTAGVVDDDGGEVAAAFTGELVPALVEEGILTVGGLDDVDAARAELEAGGIDAVWVLPQGLSDGVTTGAGGTIEVLVNPDRALSAEIARSVAEGFAARIDAVALAVATTVVASGEQLPAGTLEAIGADVAAREPLVRVGALIAPDERLDQTSYLAAGMAAFFVFFTVQFGVTGLLEERQLGTMPRLLAAPITPSAIQAGKGAGAFLLGLVAMTVLAVASALLLGASWGPPLGVAIMIVALVVAATGLMAFVGSFARTAEQAGNLQAIVAVSLGMVGGVFFPVPAGLLTFLSRVSPHGWFLQGLGAQVGTGQWTAVLPAAGAVAAFGVVAAVPAVVRLRRAVRW